MIIKKYALVFIILINLVFFNSIASANTIKICASLTDFGSIASYVGGSKVEVFSIAKNNTNPHFVDVLPSYMIKVSKCDIYLKVGLSLDQWADQIIDGSRNNKILVVDCSNDVKVLDKPNKVDASMGDVHPQGNPHYWLEPSNGIIIANNILESLKKIDPSNAEYYSKNYEKFENETKMRIATWNKEMEKLSGEKIISYHSSWVYFAKAFDLNIAGNVEPFPGIPPTAKHLNALVNSIQENNIKILIQETYFRDSAPNFLARKTGIKILKCNPSCIDVKSTSYLQHFDELIEKLKE